MVIVRIQGGLGNQLFEYAFALWLQEFGRDVRLDISLYGSKIKKTKVDPVHNGFELPNIFNIDIKNAEPKDIYKYSSYRPGFIPSVQRKLFGLKSTHIRGSGLGNNIYYNPQLKEYDNVYFDGYWATFLYSEEIKETVRRRFEYKMPLDARNSEVAEQMKATESVSLHIRRGDYLNLADRYLIPSVEYYRNSIYYIKEKVLNPRFYFFSDDIEWCKQQFKDLDAYFIDWNTGNQSYVDMRLMSCCKHNILANSTFSMWAAWLNDNEKKIVIRPRYAYIDHKNEKLDTWPGNWISMDN